MDYWTIKQNLLSKSRTIGGLEISNDLIMETVLRANLLGLLQSICSKYGVHPQAGVAALQGRLNKGLPLSDENKDYEGLLIELLSNNELRKSLSSDGYMLDDLSAEDAVGLIQACRQHKAQSAAALQKSTSQIAAESACRARILGKVLQLRMNGALESIDVTKIENRLNKHLPLSEEHKSLLGVVADSIEVLEKSWNQDGQRTQLLQKTQKDDWDWDHMTPRDRARYIVTDGKPSARTLMKGEDTPICVERKDGTSRNIPLRKIREQLNSLAVCKSREVNLPITQVNGLLNAAARGSEAAKNRLETEYGYFLEKLFT